MKCKVNIISFDKSTFAVVSEPNLNCTTEIDLSEVILKARKGQCNSVRISIKYNISNDVTLQPKTVIGSVNFIPVAIPIQNQSKQTEKSNEQKLDDTHNSVDNDPRWLLNVDLSNLGKTERL